MRIKIISFILLSIPPLMVNAQFKSGNNVVIEERSPGDVYLAGKTVTINAPIAGDLIIAGGTININDSINADLLAAGGNIFINGPVRDDIRCAGGEVHISKDISGDLVVTGGTITVDKGVTIFGNLLSSGGEVILNGMVEGDIKSASGTFTLNGVALRNFDCRGGKVNVNGQVYGEAIVSADKIEIGNDATFAKSVRYWNNAGTVDFHNSVKTGSPTFDLSLEIESGKWHYLGFASFLLMGWYLGTALLFIVLIHYLFPKTFKNAAASIRDASLKSLGLGFLFLVAVPIIVIISFVTVLAIPIGLLILAGYVTLVVLATIIVALLIANWINTNFNKDWTSGKLIMAAFGIFVVLKLASLTPVVGPLIMLLLVCMGFGGILQNVKWRRHKAYLPPM